MHFLLFYEVGEDYATRRVPFREEHLKKAWEASDRGELVLGGALANPMDCSVLLFDGDSQAVAENFAQADPMWPTASSGAGTCESGPRSWVETPQRRCAPAANPDPCSLTPVIKLSAWTTFAASACCAAS